MNSCEDYPVQDVGSVLSVLFKNIGLRFHLTWNKEGESSNVDCETQFIFNADEPEKLLEDKN